MYRPSQRYSLDSCACCSSRASSRSGLCARMSARCRFSRSSVAGGSSLLAFVRAADNVSSACEESPASAVSGAGREHLLRYLRAQLWRLRRSACSDNDHARVLGKAYSRIERAHQTVLHNAENSERMPAMLREVLLHRRTRRAVRQLEGRQRRFCRNLLVAKTAVVAALVGCRLTHTHQSFNMQ